MKAVCAMMFGYDEGAERVHTFLVIDDRFEPDAAVTFLAENRKFTLSCKGREWEPVCVIPVGGGGSAKTKRKNSLRK